MVELTIDNQQIRVEPGTTILAACGALGIEIPRFCYHEELSIAGNCRMCLVQVKNAPKPVASCAMPVMEGMVVETTTELVKKAREGVMGFLLKNHPLDCPICDQAGECDLQDQALHFGSDRGRYYHSKRGAQDNLNTGPLIKTIMTRCIHCTRCIRFAEEIGGVQVYGTTGRGEETQVGTYIENLFSSPLSGNVIDLCPVGALTNKPYSFRARPWELKHTETYHPLDMECSPIRIDHIGHEIQRIVPRQEIGYSPWISDRTRYSFDGLYNQRLDHPLVRYNDEWDTVSWEEMFTEMEEVLETNKNWISLAGPSVNLETIFGLEIWQNQWILEKQLKQRNPQAYPWNKLHWQTSFFNSFDSPVDSILLINTPIFERAPVLYGKIGQLVRQNKVKVYTIGTYPEIKFKHTVLGTKPQNIDYNKLKLLKKTAVMYSPEDLVGKMGGYYNELLKKIEKEVDCEWNAIHDGPASVGSHLLDLAHYTQIPFTSEIKEPTVLHLIHYDNQELFENKYFQKAYNKGLLTVIYQGSHGDISVNYSNYILPSAAYTEEIGTFVNPQGELIQTRPITKPNGLIRSNWDIISNMYKWMWNKEIIDADELPMLFAKILENKIKEPNFDYPTKEIVKTWEKNTLFMHSFLNFYNYNALCRASKTMNDCNIFNQTEE